MKATTKVIREAAVKLMQRINPQPSVDDYIRVANYFRTAMGKHLINLATKKIPETGEPVTVDAFMRSIEPWEHVMPGAGKRIQKMAQQERRHPAGWKQGPLNRLGKAVYPNSGKSQAPTV